MTIRKGETIELTVDGMAPGGSGIARKDGFVVFVRGGIPLDTVRALVFRKKKQFAEARVVEVVSPSPDRIDAPCEYFGHCGGCQWQHIPYDRQLQFKEQFVKEALERIGGFVDTPVYPTVPSPEQYGYRNKMEFSFSDRRWLLPRELIKEEISTDFALGLHVPGTFDKVMDLETCLLQPEKGNQILRIVKGYARDSGIPAYGLKSHTGFWRFLTLRYGRAWQEWMVNVVTSETKPAVLEPLAEMLSNQCENLRTVVNSISRRKASIAVGEEERTIVGDGHIQDKIGPYDFQISPNSFFQTNPLAANRLYEKVVEFLSPKGKEVVLDLYSGTGTIAIFLASRVQLVVGMEISRSAVLDAEMNCRQNGIENCRFVWGDIREKLEGMNPRPDALIVDPPRVGMHKDVPQQILSLCPKRIIYVSCNPATLARDLAALAPGYEVVGVQPVDMFPHTHHVEAVAKLVTRKGFPKKS
jgi:23S rRNA (uracil1939-C5)-methyltransferase